MRSLIALSSIVLSSASAFAHTGHVSELSGHSHFVAFAAAGLALAIGVGAFAVYKRSKNV